MTHIYMQDPSARLLYVGCAAFADGTPVRLGQPAHLPRLHSKQAWATDGKAWRMVERSELTRTNTQTPTTMQTKTINIFSFAELSDTAKDTARNWFRNHALDYEWWDCIYEDAAHVGIKITGFDIGRGNDIDGTIDDTEETAHKIVKEHGETCETFKTAAAYLKERDAIIEAAAKDEEGEVVDEYELDAKLDEAGEDFTRSILEDYLITLRNEYEYRMSDEAIDEDIEANEYTFTEEGKREDA